MSDSADFSDSSQAPIAEASAAHASSASSSTPQTFPAASDAAHDALLALYERACGEMQLAGRRLQRQMQDYQAVLLEIQQLEQVDTPQARDKLARLDALLDSDSFQRESREIERMAAALAGAIGRLNAETPVQRDEGQGVDGAAAQAADGATKRAPARGPVMRRACA